MTDAEARAWLEEHREQLELIVLTRKLTGRRVPGSSDAGWALASMAKNFTTVAAPKVVPHAKRVLRQFTEWSAGVDL